MKFLIRHQTTRIVDFGPVGTIEAGLKSKCEQFDHHFFRKILVDQNRNLSDRNLYMLPGNSYSNK